MAMINRASMVPIPTAFIPIPVEAYRLVIGTHFVVGGLSVFIWDLLFNLRNDYLLIRTHQAKIPLIVYFISRISTLAFAFLSAIGLTLPIHNCQNFSVGILVSYNLLISSTMLLSYFRVCSVWDKKRSIVVGFGFLWLVGVAGSLTTIGGLNFAHFFGSPYCTEMVSANYTSLAVFGATLNHLAIFAAITYGLGRSYVDFRNKFTITRGYQVFILGESLPALSKTILQASQLCYLVAMLAGGAAIVWFYVFSLDSSYRLSIFVPYAVTVNIMFAWVFRKAKLEASNRSSQEFNMSGQAIARQVQEVVVQRTSEWENGAFAPVQIEVNEIVEHKGDFGKKSREDKISRLEYLDFVV